MAETPISTPCMADSEDGSGATMDVPPPPASTNRFFDELAATVGQLSRVVLADEDAPTEPVLIPLMPATCAPADRVGRLEIVGQIDVGGMGVIFKGRDGDLGRDLAVKTLRPEHGQNPDMVRRLLTEAQIGGQLQHFGVVPVHELGRLADHRPYFAMKLVKGQNLARLLAGRTDPASDLPRFLAIFETVCQTMAYAHSRGVIHRDLKPPNIMVGGFGEVHVMDWGLAKVLIEGQPAAEMAREQPPATETIISTNDEDTPFSQHGTAMGTPPYMPPEQARGEVALVDRRADVFALGSILCEILTGKPAYAGKSARLILVKAAEADLDDALARLDACGADSELIELAEHCLAPERDDRPRDAGVLAERVGQYRVGVQERLRAAEIARAAEAVRAEEATRRAVVEQHRRRLTLALASAILGMTFLGGGLAWKFVRENQDRRSRFEGLMAQAESAMDRAEIAEGDASSADWEKANAAIGQAEGLHVDEKRLARLRDRMGRAGKLRDLLSTLETTRNHHDENPKRADEDFARAFTTFGVDVGNESTPPDALKADFGNRPSSPEIAAALDDWSFMRRMSSKSWAGKELPWKHLVAAARVIDPDPWRGDLRELAGKPEAERNAALDRLQADLSSLARQKTDGLILLARLLEEARRHTQAQAVLRLAWRLAPNDYWVNLEMANSFLGISDPEFRRNLRLADLLESIQYYRAAIAIRPRSSSVWGNLSIQLLDADRVGEAINAAREAVRLDPQENYHHVNLGLALQRVKQYEPAIAQYREAIRLDPKDFIAHLDLGTAYSDQGRVMEAIAEARTAIQLKPDYAMAHGNLAQDLAIAGQPDEAVAEAKEAIRLDPLTPSLQNQLGVALASRKQYDEAILAFRKAIEMTPQDEWFKNTAPVYYGNIAHAFARQGKRSEAEAEAREAIRIDPKNARGRAMLGTVFFEVGDLDGAVAEYRAAIKLDVGNGEIYKLLGDALRKQGKMAEAEEAHREAARLNPKSIQSHLDLGLVLLDHGQYVESMAENREALRINPNSFIAHNNLAIALVRTGQPEQALKEIREALRLEPSNANNQNTLASIGISLQKWEEAVAAGREAIRLEPGSVFYNNLALALLLPSDPARRNIAEGLKFAQKCTEVAPKNRDGWNTLGIAEYRSGHWDAALAALEKSAALPAGGDAWDTFFQAMALWQKGERDKAKAKFTEAVAWTKAKAPGDQQLRNFWEEAAGLMGEPRP